MGRSESSVTARHQYLLPLSQILRVRFFFKFIGTVEAEYAGSKSGFVAHVLTTLPESELENHILRLEGERASWNEVAAQFKATVERRETTAGEAGDMLTTLLSIVARGGGSTGWGEASQREGCGRDAAGAANAL
jgi:cytochrome P450